MTTTSADTPIPEAKPAPCSPLCLGFAVFNEDDEPTIRRCDECNRFADDYAAMLYAVAMTRAAEKSGLRPRALSDGPTVVDPNGGPWLPTDPANRPLPAQDHDPLVCSYCGAEGITMCVRVNQTTGQVDTEDGGGFPFCDRCKHDEGISPIPRSTYEDPGPDDCVEHLIRLAGEYIDGKRTRKQIAGYFEVYGPGLVRSYSKVRLLNLATLKSLTPGTDRSRMICDALGGTVGEAFLASVFPCF